MAGPEPVETPDAPADAERTGRRAATFALVLGALALVALTAAPHAYLVDEPRDGGAAVSQLRFWWQQVAWDADHATVPGASAVLGALAATVLAVGTLLFWTGVRRRRGGLALGGAATALAGAVPTVVYAALWTGRLLTSLTHTVAGYDAPAQLVRLPQFTDDAHTAVWTIGPVLVLGLAVAAVQSVCRGLATLPVGAFDLRVQAARHLRAASLAVVALAVLFVVPWSIQTLPDNTDPPEGVAQDDDAFWFSAYDAFRVHEGTTAVAQQTNAGAAVQYGELLQLLWWAVGAVAVVLLASLLAAHGTLRGAAGDRNLGNLWQAGVYAGVLASVGLFAVALLGALWLHRPNADIPDRGTFLGLAAAVPAVLALLSQVAAARELGRESGTLLADDFPEPILYD